MLLYHKDGINTKEEKKVLIVDDVELMLAAIEERIKDAFPSWETRVAASHGQALEFLGVPFDCLVTDYDIAGESGADLIRKFKAAQPGIKAILMSGRFMDDVARDEGFKAGATFFLQKPFLSSQLVAAFGESGLL